ncbi:hypothetical protein [Fimbriiglobus ruber]|uniref:Carboxypeptidase regulatory-like domain-containing protein n=1 Tax=Fimbriiglobus ruber TaxID=1908690 RepID=A0A225DW81_9BACT|nr:hypothetical protein [Fimbriiglobus ruber]OWK43814.1 hypothetical protein FRUB_03413 [Fimbriiglobus ruber]
MTHFLRLAARAVAPVLTVAGLAFTAAPANAGWDNVFQVCCWDCKPKPKTSYYSAPAPAPTTVQYEQRCYYEPVTVMKQQIERVEVPVQVKSYYWDPVTTYTQRSYYDPCSGCSQQVTVPRTSYVRKEECNTVMKVVERMQMVPVQVQRKVCEKRPVYTYYGPTTKTYDCATCDAPAASGASPRIDELRQNPPSVMPETGGTIAPQGLPTIPGSMPRTSQQSRPYTGTINARTTSRSGPAVLRGEVVQNDQITPRAGAKLVFVSAADSTVRQYATADDFGNFDLKLPAGTWYMYVGNGDGKAQFHKKITVDDFDAREFKVVSR